MSQYDEVYSKELVAQAKKDIQTLVKEKSILVKVDFSKQDDIDKFFGDYEFPEYVDIVSNV